MGGVVVSLDRLQLARRWVGMAVIVIVISMGVLGVLGVGLARVVNGVAHRGRVRIKVLVAK